MKKEQFVKKHLEGKKAGVVPEDERAQFLADLLAVCEEESEKKDTEKKN